MSNGSPQQSRIEIHTVVYTDTADYHTAGADVHHQVVRSNRPMEREGSNPNNEVFLESFISSSPEIYLPRLVQYVVRFNFYYF